MISYMLKLLFVLIFLVSAVSKMLSFNDTLVYFAGSLKISLPILSILLSILIIFELVIPVIVWIKGYHSKMVFGSILFLLFTFLIANSLFFVQGLENCGCYGTSIKSSPIVGIIKTVILMIILTYLRKNRLILIKGIRNGLPR
jgi:hypothetical protein